MILISEHTRLSASIARKQLVIYQANPSLIDAHFNEPKSKKKGNIVKNFISSSLKKGVNFLNNKTKKRKQRPSEDQKAEESKGFMVVPADIQFEPRPGVLADGEDDIEDYDIYQNLTRKFSNGVKIYQANPIEFEEIEIPEIRRFKRSSSESKVLSDDDDFEELTDQNYMFTEEEWKQLLNSTKKKLTEDEEK